MSYSCNEIVKLISNWAIVRAFGIVWKGNCYYHTDAAATYVCVICPASLIVKEKSTPTYLKYQLFSFEYLTGFKIVLLNA